MTETLTEKTNGRITVKKIYFYLLLFIAVLGALGSFARPYIWGVGIENRVDNLEKHEVFQDKKYDVLEIKVDKNSDINTIMDFNLQRLMEEKFHMKYKIPLGIKNRNN